MSELPESVSQLSPAQIDILCRRAFGPEVCVIESTPLGGGTFNLVYHLELSHGSSVVLRIAPPSTSIPYWDDVALMRREYAIQPHLASLGSLIPPVLFVDFTRQLIDRDYMLQSYCAGERWEDVIDELDEADNLSLWRQFGAILRRLHDTTGEGFGWPAPGQWYATWVEAITVRFLQIIAYLEQGNQNTNSLHQVFAYLQAQPQRLAEVQRPCLLHGDLWCFNLLIDRQFTPPQIVGVIDADRAWWGDPLADMTNFLLAIRTEEPEWQAPIAAFCGSYGPLAPDEAAKRRLTLYKAMHLGAVAAWYLSRGEVEVTERALAELDEVTTELLSGA